MSNQEWAVVVNWDDVVCAIVFSRTTRADQWPGIRVIAASKASTANGFSHFGYTEGSYDRQTNRRLGSEWRHVLHRSRYRPED